MQKKNGLTFFYAVYKNATMKNVAEEIYYKETWISLKNNAFFPIFLVISKDLSKEGEIEFIWFNSELKLDVCTAK